MECVPCFNAERGGRYGDTLWSNQSVIKFSFAVCHQIFILKNKGLKNNMSKEKAKHIWFFGCHGYTHHQNICCHLLCTNGASRCVLTFSFNPNSLVRKIVLSLFTNKDNEAEVK